MFTYGVMKLFSQGKQQLVYRKYRILRRVDELGSRLMIIFMEWASLLYFAKRNEHIKHHNSRIPSYKE